MASGGTTLYFTPYNDTYAGSISNITLRKIQENGEKRELEIYSTATDNHTQNYGFWNTFIGHDTAENAVGTTRSIAIGAYTLRDLQGGHRNIGIGTFAMSQLIGGEENISIGADSMLAVKNAEACVAMGMAAMYEGASRKEDIAIGKNALRGVSTSETEKNIAIGNTAGYKVTTAKNNILIGNNAGYNMKTGNNNVFVGPLAGRNADSYGCVAIGSQAETEGFSQSTAIGYLAKATKSKQVVLGNDNTVETLLKGDVIVRGTDGVYRQIELATNKSTVIDDTADDTNYPTTKAVKDYVDTGFEINTITETAEGSSVNITDSANTKLKDLNIYGKTTQFSTTGKNLLDGSLWKDTINSRGITVQYLPDEDCFLLNGTAAMTIQYAIKNVNIPLAVGENYTISSKIISGTVTRPNESDYFVFYLGQGDTLESYENWIGSTIGKTTTKQATKKYCSYAWFYITQGIVLNNVKVQIVFSKGTDDTYEPYTGGKASPSVEYPQPFVSVGDGGSIETKVYGGNIFDASALKPLINSLGIYEDGYKITAVGGTKSGYTASSYYLTDIAQDMKGKTVVFSADKFTSEQSCSANVQIRIEVDGVKSYHVINATKLTTTITIPEAFTYVQLQLYTNGTSTALTTDNTVVIEGLRLTLNEDVPWEKFKEPQTASFSTPNGLPGVPVTSGGNYTDENGQQWICDEIDLARDKYVQRVYHFNTSVDGWAKYISSSNGGNTEYAHFIIYPTDKNIIPNYKYSSGGEYCKQLKSGNYDSRYTQEQFYVFNNLANKGIAITVSTDKFGTSYTAEAIDAFLANYPLDFILMLAEPIERDLTDEEIAQYKALTTHKPVTNVFNDAGAHMKVDYVADPKTYIDNKIDEKYAILQSAILNLGGVI